MQPITDPDRIDKMIRAKHMLEVRLAKDLLKVFNDEKAGLIGPIRYMVKLAIKEMHSHHHKVDFQRKWYGRVNPGTNQRQGWRDYAGCAFHDIKDWNNVHCIHDILAKVDHFKAEHCADWIRIYGEMVEDVAGGSLDLLRKSYQKGDPYGYHWTKFPLPGASRRRIQRTAETEATAMVTKPTPIFGFMRAHPSAGIERWIMMPGDTCAKMDQVFGLMPGATISGTTTDNIFFFKKFNSLRLDPIFFLLPTATIVACGHHTLLEVALPLALNGLAPYVVGYYSTLFPKRGALPESVDGIKTIRHILESYETSDYNHLMLNFYSKVENENQTEKSPQGCFLYDRTSDERTWKAFAKVDEELMDKFRVICPWPKRLDVLKLVPRRPIYDKEEELKPKVDML